MAFPSVVASTAFNNNTANSSWTPLNNSACQTGELLLFMSTRNDSFSFTASGDWTQVRIQAQGSVLVHQIFYTVATADTISLTLTSSSSSTCSGVFVRVAGADGSQPFSSSTSALSAVPDPPNLNAVTAKDYLWIATRSQVSTANPTAGPANYSGLTNSAGSSVRTSIAWRQLNAASENPGTFAVASSRYAAATLAITPSNIVVPITPATGDKRSAVWL